MRLFTFSLFIIVVISILGCSAENPICSTNFCAVGEVFPRSELEDGQAFSEVDIDDSVIFATLVGTPIPDQPTTPATQETEPESTTVSSIVSDVAAGGTRYTNKIVTIQGTVESVFESGTRTLVTNNDNVTFYVRNQTKPELLDSYKEGGTYTFTLFISGIDPPEEEFNWYAIWGVMPKQADVLSVDFADVIESVSQGSEEYLNRFIMFTATVKNPASIFTSDTISLVTDKDNVIFFVRNRTYPPEIMGKYQQGQSYKFTAFLERISVSEVLGVSAHSVIVFE